MTKNEFDIEFNSYVDIEGERLERKIFEWAKLGYKYIYSDSGVIETIDGMKCNVMYYPSNTSYIGKTLYLELDDVRNKLNQLSIDYMNLSFDDYQWALNMKLYTDRNGMRIRREN